MSSLCIKKELFKDNPLLSRLLELHDTPDQLYIRGALPEITIDEFGRATPRILTVVGSRKYSPYGKSAVEALLKGFSKDEVIILSGLAIGIDGIAHKTALTNNLTTIAIPGSGLEETVLYPSAHKELAKDITAFDGCLISELDDMTRATQWTFPARNRIMASLSDAVLIIEAEEKSGTLITARQALELGKDIGAVPGEIFNDGAKGTLSLIKDGATPICSHEDLRELLHLKEKTIEEKTRPNITKDEETLLSLLSSPKDKDLLLSESRMPPEHFMMTVTTLELKGLIEETFGEIRKIV